MSGSFKCRSPPPGELTALPKPISWIWSHLEEGGGEGKGGREKERKGRKNTSLPKINFWLRPWFQITVPLNITTVLSLSVLRVSLIIVTGVQFHQHITSLCRYN